MNVAQGAGPARAVGAKKSQARGLAFVIVVERMGIEPTTFALRTRFRLYGLLRIYFVISNIFSACVRRRALAV